MVIAELLIESLHGLNEIHALQLVVLSHLADEHRGVDGVLIAHMVAREVTVALLKAEDKALNLAGIGKPGDDVADVLKAGKATAQLKAILLSKGVDHG